MAEGGGATSALYSSVALEACAGPFINPTPSCLHQFNTCLHQPNTTNSKPYTIHLTPYPIDSKLYDLQALHHTPYPITHKL